MSCRPLLLTLDCSSPHRPGGDFYGRTSIDGFQAHWRSVPVGTASTLQTGGTIGSWVRLVRKGNSISAFRASDAGGASCACGSGWCRKVLLTA